MQQYSFTPYPGPEPYIFISYAHKDTDLVFPILEELYKRGYRFWYDDGIAPGSEWPETIAQHLNSSSVFISFITSNAVESNNCRREINYALSKNKPFLAVLLRPTEFSPGLELQLASQQCVMKYKYTDNEQKFFNKMLSCVDLDICRKDAAEVPAKEPAPEKNEQEKPAVMNFHRPARWLKIGLVALCLILAGTLGLRATNLWPKHQDPAGSAAVTEEALPENPRTIYLYTDDMTAEQSDRAVELLTQRLELLAPGQYTLVPEDDRYVLTVSQDCFKDADITKVMRHYLTRPTELYAVCNESTFLNIQEHVPVQREDIESLTAHTGYLPGVDVSEYGITTENYTYLELTLTEAWVEEHNETVSAWGDKLIFAQDLVSAWGFGDIAEFPTVPAGDKRTFYLIGDDVDMAFASLWLHNLTSEPLPATFSFRIEEVYTWEDPQTAQVAGENQVSNEELTGNLVTVSYDHYDKNADLPTLLKLEIAMKARFDLLGQPYSFGRSVDRPHSLVFRTKTDRMNKDLATLLGGYSSMTLKHSMTSLSCSAASPEAVTLPNGAIDLRLKFEDASLLERYSQFVCQQEDQTVTLWIDETPFATAEIPAVLDYGVLPFTNCTMAGLESLTEETKYLYDIAVSLGTEPYRNASGLSLVSLVIDEEAPQVFGLASSHDQELTKACDAISKTVKTLCPEGNVWLSDNSVWISLALDVDERFVTDAPALIREIAQTHDITNTPIQALVFVLIEENDSVTERARVFLSKNIVHYYATDDTETFTDGSICYRHFFQNGRMEAVGEAIAEALNNDPYLSSFPKDPYS